MRIGLGREREALVLVLALALALTMALALAGGHPYGSALAAPGPVDSKSVDGLNGSHLARPVPDALSPDAAEEPSVRAPVGNPLWAIPLKSLSATRERPLFSPSRRPPAPKVIATPASPSLPPPPPSKPAPDHPPLTLVGTAIGEAVSIGIFVDQNTREVVRLRAGEGHAGWTLRAVEDRKAIFEKDRSEATLALPPRSATQEASAPPALNADAAQREGGRTDPDARLVPPGKWVDGDGQLLDQPPPPPSSSRLAAGKPASITPSAWRDGDGQPASPPPALLLQQSAEHAP